MGAHVGREPLPLATQLIPGRSGSSRRTATYCAPHYAALDTFLPLHLQHVATSHLSSQAYLPAYLGT